VMIFSSDMGSLTVGGRDIKDYYVMLPILIHVVNFISGALALAISLSTIPNEYERHTSHLIWSRGVGQGRYHMQLAIGNVLVSWMSGAILYLTLGIFAVINGYKGMLGAIAGAYLIQLIYVTIISALTSCLSIVLFPMANGIIMILTLAGGAFYGFIRLLTAAVTGMGGRVLKILSEVIPNLQGLSRQCGYLVQDKPVDLHVIVAGLCVIWLAGLGILCFRRKEA
ncbi:MAG: hypothetical protein J6P60_06435, partial [Lachnospiraceae bacterium]|nr:hypothetical protein [Lachnospiraceae bacterium]